MQAEIMTVTPAIAREWLKLNTNNRILKRRHIRAIANDILAGDWRVNGEAIKWSGNAIVDGQHRLHAIILADTPVQTLVIRGVEEDAVVTMDTHAKRTVSDHLYLRGEKNYRHLAGAVGYILKYRESGGTLNRETTPSEALKFIEENPLIRHSVSVISPVVTATRFSAQTAAAFHFLFAEASSVPDADEFIRLWASGEGLSSDDPIFLLRKRLIEDLGKTHRHLPARYKQAIVIKAWNAWIRGDIIGVLKWTPGGAKKEAFPVILGPVDDVDDADLDAAA